MKQAKFENLYAQNRHALHEVVPLDTPYSVNIEPVSRCNIKCVYCIYSLPPEKIAAQGYENNYCGGNMTDETFDLLLEQLCEFPNRIASITFGGVGEPLLHKKLPQMIARIKNENITDRVNLITNGIMLSPKNSLALIDAGLSSMKISLQGITSQAYEETCGVKIDFDKFVENIDFLYKNKKQCSIGIKVPDISLYRHLNSEQYKCVEEQYYKIFEDKCDKLGIEHIVKCFSDVDYSKIEGMSGRLTRYDIPERKVKVCSQPFYRMNVMQNGCVSLCTMLGLYEEGMNIHNYRLREIWESETRKRFLIKALRGIEDGEMEKCKTCNVKWDFAYEEDNLDFWAEEIEKRLL